MARISLKLAINQTSAAGKFRAAPPCAPRILQNTSRIATIAQMNRATRKAFALWWVAVVAFVLIGLWPVWSTRFPPMQDYPQHLLQAQLLASACDAPSNY